MTTATHSIIGFLIVLSLRKLGIFPAVAIGSVAGLAHHLITDRLVFECIPFREKVITFNTVLKYVLLGTLYIAYLFIIGRFYAGWVFLIPMFVAAFPDICSGIFKLEFPFHKNYQTWVGTLSVYRTILVESLIVIVFLTCLYAAQMGFLIMIIGFLVSLTVALLLGRADRYVWRR